MIFSGIFFLTSLNLERAGKVLALAFSRICGGLGYSKGQKTAFIMRNCPLVCCRIGQRSTKK